MIVVVSWGKDFSCASTQLCSEDFLTLWNPSHYFSFSFWQVLCCRFQCCKEGLACKPPRKTPPSRSAWGCLCTMKARTGLQFCFPKAPLKEQSTNALSQSIQDAPLCTKGHWSLHNQPNKCLGTLWGTHHGQELKGLYVPLACTGAAVKPHRIMK